MSRLIKIEQEDTFSEKLEDDNNLKCGEIVFSNNLQFCFSCVFCQKVCEKIQEFFRHVLYDHLNYLDDYQLSEDEEFSLHKILEPKTKQPMGMTEFIDVDLNEDSTKLEKIDFSKHFEHFVTGVPPTSYIKAELDKDDNALAVPVDCDLLQAKAKSSYSSTILSDPQDMLHIEILEEPSGSDYELENTTYSNENTSEHHEPNYDEDGDEVDSNLEQRNAAQFDSENDADNNANENKTATKDNIYKCTHCHKVFVTKRGVMRHVANIHRTKPDYLTCDKCSKTFKTETQLELHNKRHMGVKPHPCEICGACFSDKSNLNVHILRHKGIKPHKCTVCEKRFHSTTERKLHMRSHTGERPFICEVCGRKFSNSGHLCSHRRRHFGEKRFECDHCQKRFFDRKLLNDHKVMHTDERPFACDACGATFQRKKALLQHEKLHSGVKQYVCKICGKSFAQNAGLYSHMKYH